jgi:uncharacterized phage-associated protein
MPYSAKAIANYFLDLARIHGQTLNPMKIQKLVYYAHAWNLVFYNRPLIDEFIQAWTYGPVIRSLYEEFKRYGSGPITTKATEFAPSELDPYQFVTPSIDDYPYLGINQQTKALLDTVWEAYGGFSAIQLSNLTHAPDSPWFSVYNKNPGRKGLTIPDQVIREHFVSARAD